MERRGRRRRRKCYSQDHISQAENNSFERNNGEKKRATYKHTLRQIGRADGIKRLSDV